MTVASIYNPYGIRIHTDDIDPAQTLGAITQFSVPDDVNVEREILDGNIFPSLTSLTQHNERFEFTTLNIDRLLDIVGTVGMCAKGVTSQTGFELFLSKKQQCTPGPNAGTVNMRLSSKSTSATTAVFGMLTPGQLLASHAANATMTGIFTPQANQGNAGILSAKNVALPSIIDSRSRFALSEAFDLNGTTILGKKSININFGANLQSEGADGQLAPEWVSIENLMAMITVTGIMPEWAVDIPRGGKAFAHANCEFFLRKRDPDAASGYFADEDEEHIKFTAAGKAFVTNLASGQPGRPVESALVMYVEFDGTNAPIVAATDQAIA